MNIGISKSAFFILSFIKVSWIVFAIIFLYLVASKEVFAQKNLINLGLGELAGQLNWNNTIQPPSPDIEGSPYLNEEFEIGEVFYGNKYKLNQIPLRYNIYNDEMEYRVDNSIMAFANPHQIDKVIFGKNAFIYLRNEIISDKGGGFVKIWNNQYPAIITKMSVEYLEKEPPKALIDPKPPRFVNKENQHFLIKSKTDIVKIRSVKRLIESLGEYKAELTRFAKNEKLSARKPEELAKLLDYYSVLNQSNESP
jgi:hypothetical protein